MLEIFQSGDDSIFATRPLFDGLGVRTACGWILDTLQTALFSVEQLIRSTPHTGWAVPEFNIEQSIAVMMTMMV